MIVKNKTISGVILAGLAIQSSAYAAGPGLLDDDNLVVNLRTYYFNRDKDEGRADSKAASQALRLDYQSGYAHGIFGFDASLFSVGKLIGDRGEGGTGLLQDEADGSQGGYTKLGQAMFKLRPVENFEIRAGRMVLDTPLFNDSDSRSTPSATQAVTLTGNIGALNLYGIWSDKATSKTENDFESYQDNRGNDYEVAVVGGGYSFDNGVALQIAYGEAENVLQQAYLNVSYPIQLSDGVDLSLDLTHYSGKSDGDGALDTLGTDYDSDLTNLATQLRIDNMKFTLSFQTVDGDEYEESWDGFAHDDNGLGTWNSVQRLDFDRAEEDSWQARFDYQFAKIPGLNFMTRYIRGENIRRLDGSEGKEWERDIEIQYKFQNVEGLSLRWRNATVRSTETFDSDENRLILNYSKPIL